MTAMREKVSFMFATFPALSAFILILPDAKA